jgi:RNA polymerase sigma factor (TIGR02999 family)
MTRDDLVRRLMREVDDGKTHMFERLADTFIPFLEGELRGLVRLQMGREGSEITFQPTALVNEAALRSGFHGVKYRTLFVAIAASVVRQVLVDVARTRVFPERAGCVPQIASAAAHVSGAWSADLIALDDALNALAARDERRGRVAELKVFGGLTIMDITDAIYVAPATVKHEWLAARAELAHELERMDRWSVGPLPRT